MKITEVTKTIIELSDEKKEILQQARGVLDDLYNKDNGNCIFYELLEENDYDFSDFNDVAWFLNLVSKKSSFAIH